MTFSRRGGRDGDGARFRVALRRHRAPYLMIAPFFVLFGIFGLYPVGYTVWLSTKRWIGAGAKIDVGIGNYRSLFHDHLFWQTVVNAIWIFFLYVPLMIAIAVVLAVIVNSAWLRLRGFWRALLLLPYVMSSTVAAGYTFQLILDRDSGVLNWLLHFVRLGPYPWLTGYWWSRVSLGIVIAWAWLGYNMLVVLAGLQGIGTDLYEAARVDGAGPVRIFFRITVPLLRPVIFFIFTLSLIGTFALFTEPYILFSDQATGVRSTTSPLMQIFSTTFSYNQFGYASAMSWVYFLLILAMVVVQFRLARRSMESA